VLSYVRGLRATLLGAVLLLPAAAFAEEGPLRPIADIFKPLSTPAKQIYDIALVVLLITAGIFFVVAGMLVYTLVRFRKQNDADTHEPPQIYGSSQVELAWTVIPIVITVVLIVITARTIGQIQNAKMPDNALQVRVVGHQFWWEVHYDGLGIITANEIHVPLSPRDAPRPTHLTLQSADVIHIFWVPQLAGQTSLVPNRTNHTWIDPHETGTYLGNCAQYCGTQHANMLLRVIVQTPEDFAKWVAEQKLPPAPASSLSGEAAKGHDLFMANSCVSCHKIQGTVADGVFGPDLTHLMSRQTLGSGAAPLNQATLHAWITDPQNLKIGCLMPNMQLLPHEIDAITAYLLTLK